MHPTLGVLFSESYSVLLRPSPLSAAESRFRADKHFIQGPPIRRIECLSARNQDTPDREKLPRRGGPEAPPNRGGAGPKGRQGGDGGRAGGRFPTVTGETEALYPLLRQLAPLVILFLNGMR